MRTLTATAALAIAALATAADARAAERDFRAVADDRGNIAIGAFAMVNATNCDETVAIGRAELSDATFESGATSVNGRQLYVSRALDAFCLNPAQTNRLQGAPLWYHRGRLALNAPSVTTADGDDLALVAPAAAAEVGIAPGSFDLYLSERGDDGNDGRSPLTPKRTVWGCYLAATNDGERVAVYPGDYHAPSAWRNTNNVFAATGVIDSPLQEPYWLINPPRNLEFKAVGGAGRTRLVGDGFQPMANANGKSGTLPPSTNTSSLAFCKGPQVFDGFTVTGIAASLPPSDGSAGFDLVASTSPIANCVTFRNCVVEGVDSPYSMWWGGFNECRFEGTTVTNCSFMARCGGNSPSLFSRCVFENSRVFVGEGAWNIGPAPLYTSTGYRPWAFTNCRAEGSLFSLWAFDTARERTSANSGAFNACTFVWDGFQSHTGRVNAVSSSNCYFAVGTGMSATGGVNNATAASWTNALLGADYAPASVDCPAVHADGSPDSGWRQSGLGWQKTARAILDRLAALEGAASGE